MDSQWKGSRAGRFRKFDHGRGLWCHIAAPLLLVMEERQGKALERYWVGRLDHCGADFGRQYTNHGISGWNTGAVSMANPETDEVGTMGHRVRRVGSSASDECPSLVCDYKN